jgi:hypothetical protein
VCASCAEEGSQKPAEWLCVQCSTAMCQPCRKAHDKFLKAHTIVSCRQVDKGDLELLTKTRSQKCPKHNKDLEYLCSCNKVMCVSCAIIDHAPHPDKKELVEVAETHKTALMNFQTELISSVDELKKGHKVAETAQQKIQEKLQWGITAIRQRSKTIVNLVKQAEEAAVVKIQKEGAHLGMGCSTQKMDIDKHTKCLLEMNGQVDRVLRHGTEADVVQASVQSVPQFKTKQEDILKSVKKWQPPDVNMKKNFPVLNDANIQQLYGRCLLSTKAVKQNSAQNTISPPQQSHGQGLMQQLTAQHVIFMQNSAPPKFIATSAYGSHEQSYHEVYS